MNDIEIEAKYQRDQDGAMHKAEEIWNNLETAILMDKENKFPTFTSLQWTQLKKYLYPVTHENIRDFIPQIESVEIAVKKALTALTAKHEKEKQQMVLEILGRSYLDFEGDGQGGLSEKSARIVEALDVEEIAAQHNIDLSKTDVTTEI